MNKQEQTLTDNIVFKTDSYKLGHDEMYLPETNKVYSYGESRVGAQYDETVFMGLQPILMDHFVKPPVPDMELTEKLINQHIGPGAFNKKWLDMPQENGYFNLPLSIRAVPEGTPVPVGNVIMTVENTDESGDMRFLTGYAEDLLTHTWHPSAVASKSRVIKRLIYKYLKKTCENPDDFIDFMLHDFGYRSATNHLAAVAASTGHLTAFSGTDTFAAVGHIQHYYDTDAMPGYSVYATEHSVMTQKGREGEMEIFEMLLRNEKYKNGILSIVIDSYNWENFLTMAGTKFRDLIVNRPGQVVFRPDSGSPVDVSLGAWRILNRYFGSSPNKLGYRVINPKVRVLWGDGIDTDGVHDILSTFEANKISVQDILFGMGGALVQKVNRDTQRSAFKSSYQERNGIGFDIIKDPIDQSKKSKAGRLALIKTETGFKTVKMEDGLEYDDYLVEVFRNGKLLVKYKWDQVLANAKM